LWRKGHQPRVEDFLAQSGTRDPDQIVAVLRVDQWERCRLGQWIPAERYLDAFPALRNESEYVLELVVAEYLLREEMGQQPALEEYLRRFPQYAPVLELQLELHREVGADCGFPATWAANAEAACDRRVPDFETAPAPLPNIPGYEILEVLGWGGMGVVYRARQHELNRWVALKMLLAGPHASPQILGRFRVEAEAEARLQHPNIVQIYELGQHAGSLFLVLELVEGRSLARRLAGTPQPTRSAAELVEILARAIDYAHRQGVVHRDLTPANVLVTEGGVPKITDFGLAKLVKGGGDLRTQTGDLLGTPSYMAPEQAVSRHAAIGAATDVYALGAILYELLTGRPPFKAESALETLRQVVAEEPVAPARLRPKLPADLETICLKCLQKESSQRYASAQALADDLRRFLDGRPILGRRSSTLERGWRWCQRNTLLAATSFAAASAILILAAVSTGAAWTFRVQLERIRQAEVQGRERLFESLTAQARSRRYSRQVGQRYETLDALRQAEQIGRALKLPPEKIAPLRDEAIAALALPDVRPDPSGRVILRPPGYKWVAFDAAMTRYALRSRDEVLVRRVSNDEEIASFRAKGDHDIYILCFSPNGRYLATTYNSTGIALTIRDLERGAVAVDHQGPATVQTAKFSPDSRRIALSSGDGHVLVYDLATGRLSQRWPVPGVRDLDFRSDGAQVAVISTERTQSTCRILDAESGRLVRSIALLANTGGVTWSRDGTTLATLSSDGKIDLWDAATGTRKATLLGLTSFGLAAAFHPGSALLATNGWESRLRLWDPVLGRQWLSFTSWAYAVQFSTDGRIVVSRDDRLVPYQTDPGLEYRILAHASSPPLLYQRASIRRDGHVLAVGSNRGVVIWHLDSGLELAFLPIGLAWHTTFEPSGDLLTSGELGVWRWPTRFDPKRGEYRIGPPHSLPLPASDCWIAEDQSGRIVALANYRAAHVVTPEREFQLRQLDQCRAIAVSPDGEWLATGSHGANGAQVWRVRDATLVRHLAIEGLVGVGFSPDGKWLMTTSSPCRLWAVDTWEEARRINGYGFSFSPDGRLLVVQDASKDLKLVETETGRILARLESPHQSTASWVTFSPDGSRLVVTTQDGPAVHVWDLRAIRSNLAEMGLDWDAPPLLSHDDSTEDAQDRPALRVEVDFGPLEGYRKRYQSHLEQFTVSPEDLVARHTERLKAHRDDQDSLHQRAHALFRLNRFEEASADFSAAQESRPLDADLSAHRGVCLLQMERYRPALDQLEMAFQADPEAVRVIVNAQDVNERAWKLATDAEPRRDPVLAARMAAFSVALSPGKQLILNTLGVALYRAGKLADAIETLETSLKAGKGQFDGFDLFFLAMAHHRLGREAQARGCFQRAVKWLGEQKSLSGQHAKELAAFRAEAESLLGSPVGGIPDDVFSWPR
jgi:serine/threonine protein kinase/WD40 repeat protein/tetratricopeptide (TPR) repeat protein